MWSYISLTIFWARCMDSRTVNGVLLGQQGTLSSQSYAKGSDHTHRKESCAEITIVWAHEAMGVWDQEWHHDNKSWCSKTSINSGVQSDQVNACNQNTMKQRMREARILLTTRVCKSAFWKAIRKVYADKDARLFNWTDEMHDFWILLNLCRQTNCKNTCFAGLENLVCPTQANDTTSWAKSTTALESSSVEIPTSTN